MATIVRHADDVWCEYLLERPNKQEALSWVRNKQYVKRQIGSLNHSWSVRVVKELYRRGASEVLAVDLDYDVETSETTECLVVLLPKDRRKRERTIEWGSRHSVRQGYAPIHDQGQKYVFLWWD